MKTFFEAKVRAKYLLALAGSLALMAFVSPTQPARHPLMVAPLGITNGNGPCQWVTDYSTPTDGGAQAGTVGVINCANDFFDYDNSNAGQRPVGAGITVNHWGNIRPFVHSVTIRNTALTAAATTDITVDTTAVNTRIIRVTADVTQVFTGGALTAVTLTCGNAAGGNQYLLSNSVFTAQNTWGDIAAEVGSGLLTATWADFGTSAAGVPGAITVSCRFTCTTANCNAATQGAVTIFVEGVAYP